MRIGTIAARLGTTPQAIRFYERSGVLPAAQRGGNRYRSYTEADLPRLRLLIGLRQLELPLTQAATLAAQCAAGRCDEVSDELKIVLADKRVEVARRINDLQYLDGRLAHLAGQLAAGEAPQPLITIVKGGRE